MAQTVRILIVGDQVIILIIPDQVQRADYIESPIMAKLHFPVHRPVRILVGDLPVLIDRTMDPVHIVVDRLIGSFGAVIDHHLAAELLRLIPAAQRLQFPDQFRRLLPGYELGRLHRINQQFQFSKFKLPGADVVAPGPPVLLNDIKVRVCKLADLRIDCAAVYGDMVFVIQDPDQVSRIQRMILIRTLQQDLHQI